MWNRRRQKQLLLILAGAVLHTVLAGCANTDSASQDSAGASTPPGGTPASLPSPGSPADSSQGKPDGSSGGEQAGDQPGDASSGSSSGSSSDRSGNAGEPGFDTAGADDDRLPDLRDTRDKPVKRPQSATTGANDSSDTATADAGSATDTTSATEAAGSSATGTAGGDPQEILTGAERVAVLDAELERGTGDFDDLILAEQEEQRRRERERASGSTESQQPASNTDSQRSAAYEGGMAGGGGSVGGGSGGAAPTNPVKYKPPEDIPSGDNDDVVARQLREAAMREPDPAVRKKLWDEYRKYKGIK